jgi:hypothetical protein
MRHRAGKSGHGSNAGEVPSGQGDLPSPPSPEIESLRPPVTADPGFVHLHVHSAYSLL